MPTIGLGEIAGVLAAATWAATALLIRAQGPRLTSMAINALRTGVAAMLLVGTWPLVGGPKPVPLEAVGYLIASLLLGLGLGDSLYFESIRRIGVSRAMPISMGYPVLTTLFAVLLLHEPLNVPAALGIGLALFGVYLVAAPSGVRAARGHREATDWTGVILAVVAAFCWAAGTLAIRPALEIVDTATANAIRMPLVSAVLLLAAWRNRSMPSWQALRGRALRFILVLGVVTGANTTSFLLAVANAGAARASVLASMGPIFAAPLAVLFLGERWTWRTVVGTLVSIAGVVLLSLARDLP